jgi:hypothetical protein
VSSSLICGDVSVPLRLKPEEVSMPKKKHAGGAGPVTPADAPEQARQDPITVFKRDDLRLKAVESQHQTQREIVKTIAQASVRRAAIAAAMVASVLICAMAMGVHPPWELALSLFFGKAPGH